MGFTAYSTRFGMALVILLAVGVLALGIPSYSGEPSQSSLLGDRHAKKDVTCQGCHQETPPSKSVTTDTCLKCHGNPSAVIQKTEKVVPNPHASPHESPTDMKCESCHHMHKASQNACARCHAEIIFKVP